MGKSKDYHFPFIYIQNNTVLKQIGINGLYRREYINPVDTIQIGKNAKVDTLSVYGFDLENHTGKECNALVNYGVINELRTDSLSDGDIKNVDGGEIIKIDGLRS